VSSAEYTSAVYGKVDTAVEGQLEKIFEMIPEAFSASPDVQKFALDVLKLGYEIGAQAATDVLKEKGVLSFED